jgi:hypothetical protein
MLIGPVVFGYNLDSRPGDTPERIGLLRLTKRSTRAAGWAIFEARLIGGGRVTANVIRLILTLQRTDLMLKRFGATVVLAFLACSNVAAVETISDVKVGDLIQIEIAGAAREEYLRLKGAAIESPEKPKVPIFGAAVVRGIVDDSRVSLECHMDYSVDGKRYRISFSGVCPTTKFQFSTLPAGTPAAIGIGAPLTPTQQGISVVRFKIEDFGGFTGFKLQRWQLLDERKNYHDDRKN